MLRRGHRLPRRSESEIEQLRAAGRLAAQTLEYIEPHVQPGVSTYELDRLCFEYITDHGAYPSPLNYPGPPLDLSKPLRFSKGASRARSARASTRWSATVSRAVIRS